MLNSKETQWLAQFRKLVETMPESLEMMVTNTSHVDVSAEFNVYKRGTIQALRAESDHDYAIMEIWRDEIEKVEAPHIAANIESKRNLTNPDK